MADKTFEIQERRAIYVYYNSYKHIRQLKKYGEPVYTSKKLRYVKFYINEEDIDSLVSQIEDLHFVKKVQLSHRPELDMDFSDKTA